MTQCTRAFPAFSLKQKFKHFPRRTGYFAFCHQRLVSGVGFLSWGGQSGGGKREREERVRGELLGNQAKMEAIHRTPSHKLFRTKNYLLGF